MTGEADLAADVVIVGSGIAGGHAAFKLAGAGVKTLVLEAGPHLSRNEAVSNFVKNPEKGPNAPYPSVPYAPHPVDGKEDDFYVQGGPDQFVGSYTRILGGTTWHWTGFADRLRPADFEMRTRYGVTEDWPITYDDLVSHYQEAENMWGVAGDPDYDWGSPRLEPYPQPPIPSSYMDQQVEAGLRKVGLHMAQFSHARNSVPFDGRPPCCGNNTCVPICPIQAKYDGSVHTLKAEALGARIVTKALATKILVDPDRKVTGIRVRHPDGSESVATGRIYVIACHAIENPRLLLNSRSETMPNGVANSSGIVGRYLLSQWNQDVYGLTENPVYPYRGPQQTSGIIEFRDGEFRRERAAVGTSFMNDGWSGNQDAVKLAGELARQGYRGHKMISALREQISRHLRLNSSAETLGDRDNRIELDDSLLDSAGIPRPKVYFKVDDYTKKGLAYAADASKKVLRELGVKDIKTDQPYLSSAIIGGTTRMGKDPKTSVVDTDLRSHDHSNLFILGTSTHITCPVNAPTLTVAANALRASEKIMQDLGTP
ncbi:GMC family oxidoreductase [Microbaculum marinum]|uniref:GMC family oxidoreductase n=1 Tax=Microbaculum marinum TaxID=1764581 RepID=A0AAW9S0E0_9HYPH